MARRLLLILWWAAGLCGTLLMFGAQVGPDDAASNLSKWPTKVGLTGMPPWLTTTAADSWAFGGGALLFVVAALVLIVRFGRTRVPEFTSMTDAARRAYEAMRKHDGLLLVVTERLVKEGVGTSSRLAACADELRMRGLPLYGEHPPSTFRELITGDLVGDGLLEFSEDAGSLVKFVGPPTAEWINLAVKERELRPILKSIRLGKNAVKRSLGATAGARLAQQEKPKSEYWLDKRSEEQRGAKNLIKPPEGTLVSTLQFLEAAKAKGWNTDNGDVIRLQKGLQEAAQHGTVRVYGRKNKGSRVLIMMQSRVLIDKTFWTDGGWLVLIGARRFQDLPADNFNAQAQVPGDKAVYVDIHFGTEVIDWLQSAAAAQFRDIKLS